VVWVWLLAVLCGWVSWVVGGLWSRTTAAASDEKREELLFEQKLLESVNALSEAKLSAKLKPRPINNLLRFYT